ncbi:arrestin domain-containing protein 4 isoform X1 [Folsomia candida]|nr:arrestin domain-containing protein 4 isoform X1 [Folsomia candida]
MASIGATLAGLSAGGRLCKPAKGDHFGQFDCEIELDKIVAKPFQRIFGQLVISNLNEIRCFGIRVQLDAIVNLKFDTKVDNRLSNHKKIEGILQDALEPAEGYYIASPVLEDLSNDDETSTRLVVLQPGTYTYPFVLTMPGETLPAPFRSQYGNLHYKIVAYMASAFCYVQVAEKALRFKGYNNLNQLPNYLEPIKNESGFQTSMFSKKKVITAIMTLNKRGFLPGDDLPFVLSIINPKWFVVRKISVNLVRRVIYNVNGATKTTLVNLDSFENTEISKDDEIYCEGKLSIPRNCMPTYNAKPVYSVIHLIQYQVKVAEYPGPMKGQLEVVIGTTKESVETLMSRRMSNLQVEDNPYPATTRERSNSTVSRLSDCSVVTTTSMPPNYSQLNSRAVSLLSLDTLPPHYDDLM